MVILDFHFLEIKKTRKFLLGFYFYFLGISLSGLIFYLKYKNYNNLFIEFKLYFKLNFICDLVLNIL
jgi:hypothetical protein